MREFNTGRLRFSYFRTTEQNRHCFVQFANQKFKSHLLTPESYELKKSRPLKRRRDVIPWYHSHLPAQSASLISISHGLPGYILYRCSSAVISPAVTGGPVGTYLSFSKTVQSCHSKAIFHLYPPVSSQPYSDSVFQFL